MIALIAQFYFIFILSVLGFVLGIVLTPIYKLIKPHATMNNALNTFVLLAILLGYFGLSTYSFINACGKYPYPDCSLLEFLLVVALPSPALVVAVAITYLGIGTGYIIWKLAHKISPK